MIRTLRVIGVVLILGGLAHFAGVGVHLATGKVRDTSAYHLAYLAMIGLVQLSGGALDITAARGLRLGEMISRPVGLISCGLVIAWALAMTPVLLHASPIFQVMPVVYLAIHAVLAVLLWPGWKDASP